MDDCNSFWARVGMVIRECKCSERLTQGSEGSSKVGGPGFRVYAIRRLRHQGADRQAHRLAVTS
jgi:hypothetical protein